MPEQAEFDPNAEQAKNGERKGAEKDFSIQLQERLQMLAKRTPETVLSTKFYQHGENEPGVSVQVDNDPSQGDLKVLFRHKGIYGSLAVDDGKVWETYENPENLVADWHRIAENEKMPPAIRMIAVRMQARDADPESTPEIGEVFVSNIAKATWETARERGAPITYKFGRDLPTPIGIVNITAASDLSSEEGTFAPDNKKLDQHIIVDVSQNGQPGGDFTYSRMSAGLAGISEIFTIAFDEGNLPPLTGLERDRNPYKVISVEQAKQYLREVTPARKNRYKDLLDSVESRATGFGVVDNRELESYPAYAIAGCEWCITEGQAVATADEAYRIELARKRATHSDSEITPEEQKQVLDALDAALLAAELPVQVNQDMEGEL